MLVRQAREAGTVLAELKPLIEAECGRPVSTGEGASGTGFEVNVFVGDEYIAKHKDATRGKIVLSIGDITFQPPRAMAPHLTRICNAGMGYEAHIWTPSERQDRTEPTSGAQRINAHLSMIECICRAIFGTHHGATIPQAPPIEQLRVNREFAVLRHGQASVLTFPMALVINEGQPLELLPPGSTIAIVSGSSSNVPAPGLGDGRLIINPPGA